MEIELQSQRDRALAAEAVLSERLSRSIQKSSQLELYLDDFVSKRLNMKRWISDWYSRVDIQSWDYVYRAYDIYDTLINVQNQMYTTEAGVVEAEIANVKAIVV